MDKYQDALDCVNRENYPDSVEYYTCLELWTEVVNDIERLLQ